MFLSVGGKDNADVKYKTLKLKIKCVRCGIAGQAPRLENLSVRRKVPNHWLSINSDFSSHTQRTSEPRCVCGLIIQYTDYQCDSEHCRTIRFCPVPKKCPVLKICRAAVRSFRDPGQGRSVAPGQGRSMVSRQYGRSAMPPAANRIGIFPRASCRG